jgi:hypothetical protein
LLGRAFRQGGERQDKRNEKAYLSSHWKFVCDGASDFGPCVWLKSGYEK